jgi:hypothetical protein
MIVVEFEGTRTYTKPGGKPSGQGAGVHKGRLSCPCPATAPGFLFLGGVSMLPCCPATRSRPAWTRSTPTAPASCRTGHSRSASTWACATRC